MKIIFIRHGEPNYEIDSLTEKGWREAELLSKRTAKWNVTDFYCSPLGRAKDTASFTLKNAGREAEILPWLREFDAPVLDPETGKRRIPWDFLPDVLDANRDLYDHDLWMSRVIVYKRGDSICTDVFCLSFQCNIVTVDKFQFNSL